MRKRVFRLAIIGVVIVAVVFVCMNYNWSNRLIAAIESDNQTDFEKIIKEKHCFSINMPAGAPWRGLQFTTDFAIKTSLQAACEIGNYDMVKKLIDEGVDVNLTLFGAESPLNSVINADTYNRFRIGRLLIDNGAAPEKADSWNIKPLVNLALSSSYSETKSGSDIYRYDRKTNID